jgi:hypothetical protein
MKSKEKANNVVVIQSHQTVDAGEGCFINEIILDGQIHIKLGEINLS